MTTDPSASLLMLHALSAWVAPDDRQEQLRQEYRGFVEVHGPGALRRENGPAHVTASCFIFSADLRETVLCFHRKGRFWVQTGGHVEPGDSSLQAAALREAREEAGLDPLSLVPGVLDLDRHDLGAGFASCRTHWDVGFAAMAGAGEAPRVSDESEQVAWFPIDCLPTPLAGGVAARLEQLREAVRARRAVDGD